MAGSGDRRKRSVHPIGCLPPQVTWDASAPYYLRSCQRGRKILFGTSNGVALRTLPDQQDFLTESVEVLVGAKKPLTCADMSLNGEFVAGGSAGGVVHIWQRSKVDLLGWKYATHKVDKMDFVKIIDVSISPDSKRVVFVGWDRYSKKRAACLLLDGALPIGSIDNHDANISSCHFRPTRPHDILSCDQKGVLNIYRGPPFRLHFSTYFPPSEEAQLKAGKPPPSPRPPATPVASSVPSKVPRVRERSSHDRSPDQSSTRSSDRSRHHSRDHSREHSHGVKRVDEGVDKEADERLGGREEEEMGQFCLTTEEGVNRPIGGASTPAQISSSPMTTSRCEFPSPKTTPHYLPSNAQPVRERLGHADSHSGALSSIEEISAESEAKPPHIAPSSFKPRNTPPSGSQPRGVGGRQEGVGSAKSSARLSAILGAAENAVPTSLLCARYSPDGRAIAAAHADGRVLLLDGHTCEEICSYTFREKSGVQSAAEQSELYASQRFSGGRRQPSTLLGLDWCPAGRYLAVVTAGKCIHILDVGNYSPIKNYTDSDHSDDDDDGTSAAATVVASRRRPLLPPSKGEEEEEDGRMRIVDSLRVGEAGTADLPRGILWTETDWIVVPFLGGYIGGWKVESPDGDDPKARQDRIDESLEKFATKRVDSVDEHMAVVQEEKSGGDDEAGGKSGEKGEGKKVKRKANKSSRPPSQSRGSQSHSERQCQRHPRFCRIGGSASSGRESMGERLEKETALAGRGQGGATAREPFFTWFGPRGIPTCMDLDHTLGHIAVGTSLGYLMFFDTSSSLPRAFQVNRYNKDSAIKTCAISDRCAAVGTSEGAIRFYKVTHSHTRSMDPTVLPSGESSPEVNFEASTAASNTPHSSRSSASPTSRGLLRGLSTKESLRDDTTFPLSPTPSPGSSQSPDSSRSFARLPSRAGGRGFAPALERESALTRLGSIELTKSINMKARQETVGLSSVSKSSSVSLDFAGEYKVENEGLIKIIFLTQGEFIAVFCTQGTIHVFSVDDILRNAANPGEGQIDTLWSVELLGKPLSVSISDDGGLLAVALLPNEAEYPKSKFTDKENNVLDPELIDLTKPVIEVYEIETASNLDGFTFLFNLTSHKCDITAIALNGEGSLIASVDAQKRIHVHAIETRDQLVSDHWQYHNTRVHTLNWSPNGNKLISASINETFIFDVDRLSFNAKLDHGNVQFASFLLNNVVICGSNADGIIYIDELTE